MSTLEERTLTKDDFSNTKGSMEVMLENGNRIPIDKYDARGLRIKYDKTFCLKIDDKRAYEYITKKDSLATFYATFGFPLCFMSLVGFIVANNINDLDNRLLTISALSGLVGLSLAGGSVGNYLRARKFKNALNQQVEHQDE